ncbi:hypothetical protein [Saccharibacillus sacchari]|uniref:hypothetical protein n=1 Tax=Saccharibacillus sacchari TaxID=456493 RepID=UPI0005659837|nr:hypothetical protein [Saccharibacillus sacchari]
MNKMSTWIKYASVSLIVFGGVALGSNIFNNINAQKIEKDISVLEMSGDVAEYYETVPELIQSSDLIVEIEAEQQETVNYSDVIFTLTNSSVSKIHQGEYNQNSIKILETGGLTQVDQDGQIQNINIVFEDNPVFQIGQKAIVFLDKYEGPVAEDAYVIKGAYQGKFLINPNRSLQSQMNTTSEYTIQPPSNGGIQDLTQIEELVNAKDTKK